MRDKSVTIGNGNYGNSWYALELFGSISQNSKSYLIHSAFEDYNDLIILKDTKEGKILTKLIEKQINHDIIMLWCKKVFIKNAPSGKIYRIIKEAKKRAFEEGKEEKRTQILNALMH